MCCSRALISLPCGSFATYNTQYKVELRLTCLKWLLWRRHWRRDHTVEVGRLGSRIYPAIVINGEDVSLLGHHESKAPACTILERDAWGLGSQNSVDIVTVVQLVIVAFWNLDDLGRITILYDNQMVGAQVWPPLLQEIEVPDGRDHNVELILQQRNVVRYGGPPLS